MDIELARTFLQIVEAGSFVRAAERLNVTQSTVSMRVKEMEARLGRPLFTRSKAGASLTAAGQHFHAHAATLVRVWQQARQEIALPPNYRAVLNVGAEFSLWDRLLIGWIGWMRSEVPDVAVRADVAPPDVLMRQLADGLLDIGVVYTPHARPGLHLEKLFDDILVLVSTDPEARDVVEESYVHVDWGPEFRASHSVAFPDLETPALRVALGHLALGYILEFGGAGYLPARLARPHLGEGKLHVIPGAPEFVRSAYVVFSADGSSEILSLALKGLHRIALEKTPS